VFQSDLVIRDVREPGDLGWVVMAHGEQYATEFGWNSEFEALVARIVASYAERRDPTRENAWIAEVRGRRVGCIFCVADPDDPDTAKLRILLVDSSARGRGVGGHLIDTCLQFARDAGYRRIVLWTNHPLEAARRLYLARGFVLVNEEPHHSFGVDLVAQTYELEL
jgi:GNAT superfamily N-acetyltransferase